MAGSKQVVKVKGDLHLGPTLQTKLFVIIGKVLSYKFNLMASNGFCCLSKELRVRERLGQQEVLLQLPTT